MYLNHSQLLGLLVATTAYSGDMCNAPSDDDDSSGGDVVCDVSYPDNTVGLKQCSPGAYEGYTLFAPNSSRTTYLVDMLGQEVHSWESAYPPGQSVYLLETGQLLRTTQTGSNPTFNGGGAGGGVELLEWNGDVSWSFTYSSDTHLSHHDVSLLPNGNLLMIAWEYKGEDEALAAGRNPSLLSEGALWPDSLIEVQPQGAEGGEIVWEWHVWDHLIQDYDSTANNYGVVADHPELINLNYADSPRADWNHTNAVDYNEELDQIIVSVHNFSEFWIIDHSTTSEEAAGHTGGAQGKGGDLLYRWGNPATYDAGSSSDQQLYYQHDAHWIPEGLPGEGNLLVFNNGPRPNNLRYSTVDELVPSVDADGYYSLETDGTYGPTEPTWFYEAEQPTDFYSQNISGAQRFANGNTLVCSGANGKFFEVTEAGEIVWEYINPVTMSGVMAQGEEVQANNKSMENSVFRAYRYAPDYAGLEGRDLTPVGTIETSNIGL